MALKKFLQTKNLVDLTHTLSEKTPTWKGGCGFSSTIKMDYDQGLRAQSMRMHAGIGTHMDAPSHFFKKGCSIAEIPLEKLLVPLVCLDISSKSHEDYQISVDDILAFCTLHSLTHTDFSGSFFACRTGWDDKWGNSNEYRNVDKDGVMHFPTYSADAADYLLDLGIVGLGIDTLSPDPQPELAYLGSSFDPFPVHHRILGAGGYIVENMANLKKLPPLSFMINLPLKGDNLTEAPSRIIALTDVL